MDKFAKYIDRVINKALNEAAEEKSKEVNEKLHGNQKNLDKNKNNKIDAEDFKLLRKSKGKKEETKEEENWEEISSDDPSYIDPKDGELDEFFYHDDESTPGDYEGNEEAEDEAEELSAQEPTYVGKGLADNKPGKIFGSFSDDHGWYNERDQDFKGEFDFDYDEEEFDEFEPMFQKYGDKTTWFRPGNEGKKFFDMYKEKFGPMKIRVMKSMTEEMEEPNPITTYGKFDKMDTWYDEKDYEHKGDFDFEYDEEEFDEFEPMYQKYGEKTRWFQPGEEGKKYFDQYRDKFGPMKIRTKRSIGEDDETTEGNAFTDKLRQTKKGEKFKLGDKTYTDTSNLDESDKKWIQKTDMKKGALHKKLGVPEGSKIPKSKLNKIKKELMSKSKGDKKLSAEDSKLLKQVNLALTLGDIKESRSKNLTLTENELIDLIEKLVIEQKTEKPKGNIAEKTPKGLEVTEKVLKQDKKENDDYIKQVKKKMMDYLKTGSKGKYEMEAKQFPKGNGELAKMDKKAYVADDDVEEYIEDFSYGGGMENLDYDEIKPSEEWMEKTMKGSSKTGNSSEYANAVETELGEKMVKKSKKNMFSNEKKNSYKKSDQPTTGSGKSKEQKDSDKLFAKLESTDDKSHKLVMEEISKMKNLFSYREKTQ